MTTISAKVVADSINQQGNRLTTMLLRYPRWIHSELLTHRAFSRNSASSRAIPVEKMIKSILDDPAVPLFWGSNKPGMQAGDECNADVIFDYEEGDGQHSYCREDAWRRAKTHAVLMARAFAEAGYHKQIVNRLVEPFMHITTLVTATEYFNFFGLRCHKDAEPHIQMLADRMRGEMLVSTPKLLKPGEWHLPFVNTQDWIPVSASRPISEEQAVMEDMIKLSVARCASTSYKTVDGFDMTLGRAIVLHDKLVSSVPMHASPCEHQATPDEWEDMTEQWRYCDHGNFKGWRQYRKMLEKKTK